MPCTLEREFGGGKISNGEEEQEGSPSLWLLGVGGQRGLTGCQGRERETEGENSPHFPHPSGPQLMKGRCKHPGRYGGPQEHRDYWPLSGQTQGRPGASRGTWDSTQCHHHHLQTPPALSPQDHETPPQTLEADLGRSRWTGRNPKIREFTWKRQNKYLRLL